MGFWACPALTMRPQRRLGAEVGPGFEVSGLWFKVSSGFRVLRFKVLGFRLKV